eukprot:6490736-Amphidinium_carterae.2
MVSAAAVIETVEFANILYPKLAPAQWSVVLSYMTICCIQFKTAPATALDVRGQWMGHIF